MVASRETARRMDTAAGTARAAGYELSWEERRVSGYPFRLDITLIDARIREPTGWSLSTPRLEAEAFLHGLDHWVFAAPDGFTFTRPVGGPVVVKGALIHASMHDLQKTPPRFSFEAADLTFTPGPGAQPFALKAADKVELHLRPGPNDQGAVLFKVENGKAQLSGLVGRIADGKPVSLIWDSLLTRMSGFRGASWAQAARAWSANGGRIQVRQAGLTAGDALIGAQSGDLGIDAEGRLAGTLEATLRQAPKALSTLSDQGLITRATAQAATSVAQARQTTGPAAQITLIFQAGRTTLGPVAIAPAPRVY